MGPREDVFLGDRTSSQETECRLTRTPGCPGPGHRPIPAHGRWRYDSYHSPDTPQPWGTVDSQIKKLMHSRMWYSRAGTHSHSCKPSHLHMAFLNTLRLCTPVQSKYAHPKHICTPTYYIPIHVCTLTYLHNPTPSHTLASHTCVHPHAVQTTRPHTCTWTQSHDLALLKTVSLSWNRWVVRDESSHSPVLQPE